MAYLSIKHAGPNKKLLVAKLHSFLEGPQVGELNQLVDGQVEIHLAKPLTMTEEDWDDRMESLVRILDYQGAIFTLDACDCDGDPMPGDEAVLQAVSLLEKQIRREGLIGLGGYLN